MDRRGAGTQAQALATARSASDTKRMSEREIETVVAALGSIRSVLESARAENKAAVYRRLNLSRLRILKPTYKSGWTITGALLRPIGDALGGVPA